MNDNSIMDAITGGTVEVRYEISGGKSKTAGYANIFAVNANVDVSGGKIDGAV